MALGVGKEVFGVGVLMGVLRNSLAADRPGPCGVHILCAAIRSTAEHKKGQCGVRGAVFGWAGGGRARAGAGGVVFAGRARVGRVHAAEGVLDARGIGPVFVYVEGFCGTTLNTDTPRLRDWTRTCCVCRIDREDSAVSCPYHDPLHDAGSCCA